MIIEWNKTQIVTKSCTNIQLINACRLCVTDQLILQDNKNNKKIILISIESERFLSRAGIVSL